MRVDLLGSDLQPIGGPDGLDRLRPELLPEARDVPLQRLGRGVGRVAVPQLLDQEIGGDRLAAMQQQDRK